MQISLVKASWSSRGWLALIAQFVTVGSLALASPAAFERISSGRHDLQRRVSARPEAPVSAVLPSPPLQSEVGAREEASLLSGDSHFEDIIRKLAPAIPQHGKPQQVAASDSKAVPVYVSPFVRANAASSAVASAPTPTRRQRLEAANSFESPVSESKTHNYATHSDLKAAASHGHHGYEHGHSAKGWLDMGAWTGGKGSFGWYADYPVGSKKHHYGRK